MFVWDEAKRRSNFAKHRIDFLDAVRIFDGPLVTVEDVSQDYGEARYRSLGLLDGLVVSMAYTDEYDRVRIISIRKASKHEARFFFSQVGN